MNEKAARCCQLQLNEQTDCQNWLMACQDWQMKRRIGTWPVEQANGRNCSLQATGQTFVQICLQTGRMAARCSSSSAGIRTTADMRSGKQQMHILQNRLAGQNGRQMDMQNRCMNS